MDREDRGLGGGVGGGTEGLTRALFLGAGLRKVIFEIGHLSLIWMGSLLWISKLLNNMKAQSA